MNAQPRLETLTAREYALRHSLSIHAARKILSKFPSRTETVPIAELGTNYRGIVGLTTRIRSYTVEVDTNGVAVSTPKHQNP